MKYFIVLILSFGVLFSCQKKRLIIGPDPYAGGKEPLGISFTADVPNPTSVSPGDSVVFQVKGLLQYKDSFDFLLNGEKAEVLTLTDSLVTLRVPDKVSTGIASIIADGQIFFGPRLNIINKVSMDSKFGLTTALGQINSSLTTLTGTIVVGSFTKLNDLWINNIGLLDGSWGATYDFNSGSSSNGPILSISPLSNGQLVISGNFTTYNSYKGFNNIVKINADGTMDTSIVHVKNLSTDPKNSLDTVSRFNGGTPQVPILKSFVTSGDRIIAVGNFKNYGQFVYSESNREAFKTKFFKIGSVVRMTSNGALDSTYNYVPGKGSEGANGPINDATLLSDGRLILVGNFTKFNGISTKNIVCLDSTGKIDQLFLNNVTGSNKPINTVQYNEKWDRLVLTGAFTSFNNAACTGLAILKGNGEPDGEFKMKKMEGGYPTFAAVLNSGKILVTGTFAKYDNVTRGGFLLLESDGTALQEYNNIGAFEGQIQNIYEMLSSNGKPAVVLMGYISKFDDQPVGNIVRVQILN